MKGQPSFYHFPSSIFGPWKSYFLVPPIFAQCELFDCSDRAATWPWNLIIKYQISGTVKLLRETQIIMSNFVYFKRIV